MTNYIYLLGSVGPTLGVTVVSSVVGVVSVAKINYIKIANLSSIYSYIRSLTYDRRPVCRPQIRSQYKYYT